MIHMQISSTGFGCMSTVFTDGHNFMGRAHFSTKLHYTMVVVCCSTKWHYQTCDGHFIVSIPWSLLTAVLRGSFRHPGTTD